jgi:alkylated DNA repair dioxygenase AlkB
MQELTFPEVDGLIYLNNFLTDVEHDELLTNIDRQTWLTDLQRRVQHYGYKYDYKSHAIDRDMYLAPLPEWALKLAHKLHERYSDTFPDQVIVNEYSPGQGIAAHIDCKSCFQETIISLSLGSPCVMNFKEHKGAGQKSLWLEPRSLIILKKAARYEWTHGIAKRKSDLWQGQKLWRSRRVSLTFRTVILVN